jgi:hypothetical protein
MARAHNIPGGTVSQPTTGILLNSTSPAPPPGNQNVKPQSDGAVPLQAVTFYPQPATDALLGVVKPDNTTIILGPDGSLSTFTAGADNLIQAVQQELYVFGLDTGAANAYLVAQAPPPNIIVGSKIVFLALNANTGPSTLTINSSPVGSSAPITKEGNLPLTGGEIDAGQIIEAVFDGTNFQIVGGGSGSISTGGSGGGGGGSGSGSGLGDVIPAGAIDGVNVTFTIPTDGSPGPGGGAGTSSGLRGSAIQTAIGTTITINFPTGSAVGDLAVAFFSCGDPSVTPTPSGWTNLYQTPLDASNWNVLAVSRVLDSGDISAGGVTFAINNGITFDLHAGIAVFIGPLATVREAEGGANVAGIPIVNVTTGNVLSSDTGVYWATNREDPGPTLPAITPASGTAAQLFNASTTNAWSLLAYQAMPGGSLSVSSGFPSPGGGAGEAAAQIIVENSGASGGGGTSGGARGNLYLNGVLQDPLKADPDYALVGTTITMRNPPVAVPSPDSLLWVYLSGSVGPPGPAGGGITTLVGDVTAGPGEGTVNATLAASGVTAGTYEKVTVDGKGRVTVGDSLSAGDIPNIAESQVTNLTADLATLAAAIAAIPSVPTFADIVPSGTKDGVNTAFTLPNTPNPASSLSVQRNGVRQYSPYITVSGANITFLVPPRTTDNIRAQYTH